MGREKITLGWRSCAHVDPIDEEYVECTRRTKPALASATLNAIVPVIERTESDFDRRMENWRKTVRGGLGGGAGGFCATWARWYVICKLHKDSLASNENLNFILPSEGAPRSPFSVDHLDGWIVEAAVRSLPNYEERKVLHFSYVFQYPERWIKTKLLLRGTAVRLVKGRAEHNLQKMFTKLETENIIHSYKLHAGVDPRPETKVALDGAALSLEKERALID